MLLLSILISFALTSCDSSKRSLASTSPYPAVLDKIYYNQDSSFKRELKEKGLEAGMPVFIRAFKRDKEPISVRRSWYNNWFDFGSVEVWMKKDKEYILFKSYRVEARSGILGPKFKEGDNQVPEGFYYSTLGTLNYKSRYHLSMNVNYPNKFDKSHKRTGSFIMIHGSNKSRGCLAMNDDQIEEIFTLTELALKNGQEVVPIHIFPFRMTSDNWEQVKKEHSQSELTQYFHHWENLKEGYEYFEIYNTPPEVNVENGLYVFK